MDMDMNMNSHREASKTSPFDRILMKLGLVGVPGEYLGRFYPGIVEFAMENRSRMPELVTSILPTYKEVVEFLQEAKTGSEETSVDPIMKTAFRESMTWLKWLMFEGEPTKSLRHLSTMSIERGVCGAVWGVKDIAYRCRTCQNDQTCAICVPCFQNSNHKDHDYSIIYTNGGCCDCGDITAWKFQGFCSKHKGVEHIQTLPDEFATSVGPVLDALFMFWLDKLKSAQTCRASERAVIHKYVNELSFVVVEMLLEFCQYSESLLSFVSKRVMLFAGLLDNLVRAESFLNEYVVKRLHELLLRLLGEPIFKYEFAKVFLTYYAFIIKEAIKESSDGALSKFALISTFSVQIFTVPILTARLVEEMNLLAVLVGSLVDIFVSCTGEGGHLQVSKLGNLSEATRRVVADIEFVMSHSVVPKYVAHKQQEILRTWMRILAFAQGMNPMKRETRLHIEEESEHVDMPFHLCSYFSKIHSLMVDGAFSVISLDETGGDFLNVLKQGMDDGDDSQRHAKVGRLSQESTVCSGSGRSIAFASGFQGAGSDSDTFFHLLVPPPVTWLTYECLRAVDNWLGVNNISGCLAKASFADARSISSGNFLALKRTLSNARKGKYTFGRFASSSDGNNRYGFQPDTCSKNLKSTACGEIDLDVHASTGPDTMEGEYTRGPGLQAFRVLSYSDWPKIVYDVSAQDVSVHIPLHRLLSLIIQRALRACYGESALQDITTAISANQSSAVYHDFFRHMLGGCHPCGFSAFIIEHPLRNRVLCAQIRAGMWRKNGEAALVAYERYRLVWSDQGFELDLFLMQCCAALAPADLCVSRIFERFGVSDYLSLNAEISGKYEPVLVQELLTLLIQIVQERRFSGLNIAEYVKRELIHKLASGDATHSQLVKSLPLDISEFDKIQEILDTIALYSNPSGVNQGMYSLRLAHWKEIDLYYPRWKSRDLQAAEERYRRFCGVSALTTQLPRWTKIYPPLKGVGKLATCETVFLIIHAVVFYAVLDQRSSETRAPDSVLLSALHLLSLSLDICTWIKESSEELSYSRDSTPILALACDKTRKGVNYGDGEQSLLSLLVLLMRMHKNENLENILRAGNGEVSSLIEILLKKFAEIDAGCLTKLQKLAPELVSHLSKSALNDDKAMVSSASTREKQKARARERQAAIMENMRAQQFKFLSSISAEADYCASEKQASNSDLGIDVADTMQDVCSLCHNSNSRSPLSFLGLLQRSTHLSFVDKGPPNWDQVCHSGGEPSFETGHSGLKCTSSELGTASSPPLSQVAVNLINVFSSYGHPEEVNAVLEFVKARFPCYGNTQLQPLSNDGLNRTVNDFETIEQNMYYGIQTKVCDSKLISHWSVGEDTPTAASKGTLGRRKNAIFVLVGKYIAALSKESTKDPLDSENFHDDVAAEEYTSEVPTYDGFGPRNCDGIRLSSCGHAFHQGCLDRYLSSLRERYVRRIVFEGSHIVDPDKGEFLCPVCRRLSNFFLPALSGDFLKALKQPLVAALSPSVVGSLASSNKEMENLFLCEALSLLNSAAEGVEEDENLKAAALKKNEMMKPTFEYSSQLLSKMYFQNNLDSFSVSSRISYSMIMWDTLKYSLMSLEIAARSKTTSLGPVYGIDSLYKELESPTGFVLSLMLRIVQSRRSQNSMHLLQRFTGLQLFAESICLDGISQDYPNQKFGLRGDVLSLLNHMEKDVLYPDVQFLKRASDPILARDPFSSLIWVIFCLPSPFISCTGSLLFLVHMFYAISVTQAILAYCARYPEKIRILGFHDCLISDLSKALGESRWAEQHFVSNYIDPAHDVVDSLRRLSFPFLRRTALLWKLLNNDITVPFRDTVRCVDGDPRDVGDLTNIEKLEKMFMIPTLNVVLKDQVLRTLARKWLSHLRSKCETNDFQFVLHCMAAVPFKLIVLPRLYQEVLERYIKQCCPDCKTVLEDPALCLLCGRLCSPSWKSCCRKSGCQTHSVSCGAGVFLLIRRTTILLQRSARQALWPSLYLDAFGEEDISMERGRPLFLNEERYAALTHMVASHGLDRSSRVLTETNTRNFFGFAGM